MTFFFCYKTRITFVQQLQYDSTYFERGKRVTNSNVNRYFFFRKNGSTMKLNNTRGCVRCCVGQSPVIKFTYLAAIKQNEVILMQYYDPPRKFMELKVSHWSIIAWISLNINVCLEDLDVSADGAASFSIDFFSRQSVRVSLLRCSSKVRKKSKIYSTKFLIESHWFVANHRIIRLNFRWSISKAKKSKLIQQVVEAMRNFLDFSPWIFQLQFYRTLLNSSPTRRISTRFLFVTEVSREKKQNRAIDETWNCSWVHKKSKGSRWCSCQLIEPVVQEMEMAELR